MKEDDAVPNVVSYKCDVITRSCWGAAEEENAAIVEHHVLKGLRAVFKKKCMSRASR